MADVTTVRTPTLEIAFERRGDPTGWPVVLLHGFPYDVRCYDVLAASLAEAGADVVVPYLRGYGPTRFLDPTTIRSGQQAALAHDLLDLIDTLGLDRPIVAGYDWGGRAACLVAMLWPDRVSGLVSQNGYNVQDLAAAGMPTPPDKERRHWYQYYLHGERGRAGLRDHRTDYARLLWQEWSPTWEFTDADFAATSGSFDNPDFVDVVVHSYRHRYGLVAGDPAYAVTEDRVAAQAPIGVPSIVLDPLDDKVADPAPRSEHERHFSRLVDHRRVRGGHNLPQENPAEFLAAIFALRSGG